MLDACGVTTFRNLAAVAGPVTYVPRGQPVGWRTAARGDICRPSAEEWRTRLVGT